MQAVLCEDGEQAPGSLVGEAEPVAVAREIERRQVGVVVERRRMVEIGVGDAEKEVLAHRKALIIDANPEPVPAVIEIPAIESGEGRKMPRQRSRHRRVARARQ